MSKNVKFTKCDLSQAISDGKHLARNTLSKTIQLPRTSNAGCGRTHVTNKLPFQGSNLYGFWVENKGEFPDPRYVVFSYGAHWPLWVYTKSTDQWFRNDDRYSITTNRHRSQSAPLGSPTTTSIPDVEAMKVLAFAGYNLFMLNRMNALVEGD